MFISTKNPRFQPRPGLLLALAIATAVYISLAFTGCTAVKSSKTHTAQAQDSTARASAHSDSAAFGSRSSLEVKKGSAQLGKLSTDSLFTVQSEDYDRETVIEDYRGEDSAARGPQLLRRVVIKEKSKKAQDQKEYKNTQEAALDNYLDSAQKAEAQYSRLERADTSAQEVTKQATQEVTAKEKKSFLKGVPLLIGALFLLALIVYLIYRYIKRFSIPPVI